MHYLGIDETKPGLLYVRDFSPTDLDKVETEIVRRVMGYYPGIDLLNADLWRKLGFAGGPVYEYLQQMMDLERRWNKSMDAGNAPEFNTEIQSVYATNSQDLIDYSRAYTEALAEGLVPETISKPWTYTATSVVQDVGAGVQMGVKTFWPLILGGVAVYALAAAFLPNLVGKLAHK
jgi:hypothetical protein